MITRRAFTLLGLSFLGGYLLFSEVQHVPKLNPKKTSSQRMPVLFVGHGSPMNAIENNPYTQMLGKWPEKLKSQSDPCCFCSLDE